MTKVTIDGIEYVPKASIDPINDAALQKCLECLTEIQYFSECDHKHRAWAWDALSAIAPNIAALPAQEGYDLVRKDWND